VGPCRLSDRFGPIFMAANGAEGEEVHATSSSECPPATAIEKKRRGAGAVAATQHVQACDRNVACRTARVGNGWKAGICSDKKAHKPSGCIPPCAHTSGHHRRPSVMGHGRAPSRPVDSGSLLAAAVCAPAHFRARDFLGLATDRAQFTSSLHCRRAGHGRGGRRALSGMGQLLTSQLSGQNRARPLDLAGTRCDHRSNHMAPPPQVSRSPQ
jgi:hypothetical protein